MMQKYAFPNKKQEKSIPENDYLGLKLFLSTGY
ncbi:MAG: hypothetical protein ACI85O_000554 [Saprospiraceae bacterium]|jgi:hypothetical protein